MSSPSSMLLIEIVPIMIRTFNWHCKILHYNRYTWITILSVMCIHSRHHIVIGFLCTYAITTYHHKNVWVRFLLCGKVCQRLSDGRLFFQVLWLSQPMKINKTYRNLKNIVESGVKHPITKKNFRKISLSVTKQR